MSKRTYPHWAGVERSWIRSMKPSKRPHCEICGERATREAKIQVDWLGGNYEVYPLCDSNVCRDTLRERECGTT